MVDVQPDYMVWAFGIYENSTEEGGDGEATKLEKCA